MNAEELKARTRAFAVRVLKFADAVPSTPSGRAVVNQIVRSGTSVAANYRAACRARSRKEFISKLGIVEEEADETAFWIELAIEAGLISAAKSRDLLQEASELTAIMVASIRSARSVE